MVSLGLIVSIVLFLVPSLFEGKREELRPNNPDLIVVACIVASVLITLLVRGLAQHRPSAFPPLAGGWSWLTNGYYLAAAAGVTVLCVVILIRSLGWIREVRGKKARR